MIIGTLKRTLHAVTLPGRIIIDINPYQSPNTTSEARPEPVKVKAYGLIPLTRTAYLTLQVVMAVAALVILFATRPSFAAPGHALGFVDDHFMLIIAVMLGLESLETVVMLMKFKKAGKKQ